MPKIWSETIAAHRDAVRETTLDATAALIAQHGLTGVTMASIARESGIGRATLYKYFPDIDAILSAWHERQIGAHLQRLSEVSEATSPERRLEAVLRAYAQLSRGGGHGSELSSTLHASEHAAQAHAHLDAFLTTLIRDAADRGEVRTDVPAPELAAFCLHALTAAESLTSKAALDRLVAVTLSGLGPGPTRRAAPH
jgi:AcrR family transcriptional regulator